MRTYKEIVKNYILIYKKRVKEGFSVQKIKNYLCSEKGMRFINVLFALSLLIRRSGIGLIAYLCWGVYLLYCIRCTEQKTMKIMYSILLAFAAAVIGLNIYLYLTLK